MKTGLFSLAGVALLQLTTAQPHRTNASPLHGMAQRANVQEAGPFWRRLSHLHHHHAKRAEDSSCATDAAIVTNTATATATVTFEFEDVIIYVDDEDRPVSSSTSYRNLVSSTVAQPTIPTSATPTAPALPRSPSSPPAPSSEPPPTTSSASTPAQVPAKQAEPGGDVVAHPPQPKPTSTPAQAQPSSSASSPSSKGGGASNGSGFESAISYTPYNADNSCKSTAQVAKDLQQPASSYEVIRLYGTDCNQVANVIAATKGNVKLFLGIFDINAIQQEIQTISSAVNGNWALVNAVSVGNELVNSGKASVGQVTSAIGTARSALKSAGYNGPVTTADTMIAMKNNPALCTASDFCAINCHAFFDGNVLPEGAGDFVKNWAQQVSEAAGGKTVIVSESGWPTQGGTNNKAVASQEAHTAAISSLKSAFGGGTNLVLYGMYNDAWKKDSAATFGSVYLCAFFSTCSFFPFLCFPIQKWHMLTILVIGPRSIGVSMETPRRRMRQ